MPSTNLIDLTIQVSNDIYSRLFEALVKKFRMPSALKKGVNLCSSMHIILDVYSKQEQILTFTLSD